VAEKHFVNDLIYHGRSFLSAFIRQLGHGIRLAHLRWLA
jgi:hypothetical protein